MKRRRRLTSRDLLWLGLVVILSGATSSAWIYVREAQLDSQSPTMRLVRAERNGGALTMDGVALGATREDVVKTLGVPGTPSGGGSLLYHGGAYVVSLDASNRVAALVGGRQLRQNGRLLLSVGDDEDRIFWVLGPPDRQLYSQSPWNCQARCYDRFNLSIYVDKARLTDYFDVARWLSEMEDGEGPHGAVRGLVLGQAPYFGN